MTLSTGYIFINMQTAADILPVVTVQNGLESERTALRRFATVFGSVLWVAATYTAPGEVAAAGAIAERVLRALREAPQLALLTTRTS